MVWMMWAWGVTDSALARVPAGDFSSTGIACRALQERADEILEEYERTRGGVSDAHHEAMLQELRNLVSAWEAGCRHYGDIFLELDDDAAWIGDVTVASVTEGDARTATVPDDVVLDTLSKEPAPEAATIPDVQLECVDPKTPEDALERRNTGTTTVEARCRDLGWQLDVCEVLLGDLDLAGILCDWGYATCGSDALYQECKELQEEYDALECDAVCSLPDSSC